MSLRLLKVADAEQAEPVTNPDAVVGERIRHIRETWKPAKLTQPQLIELLKAEGFELPSVVALSRIENGQRSLTTPQLVAVAKVLGASVETLLTPLAEDRDALAARLRDDLANALDSLIAAMDGMYEATAALTQAAVGVTLDELLTDRFDVSIRLREAHPRTRRHFEAVAEDLIRHGLSSPERNVEAARRRPNTAEQVAGFKRLLKELDAYNAPLPEDKIPTQDEA